MAPLGRRPGHQHLAVLDDRLAGVALGVLVGDFEQAVAPLEERTRPGQCPDEDRRRGHDVFLALGLAWDDAPLANVQSSDATGKVDRIGHFQPVTAVGPLVDDQSRAIHQFDPRSFDRHDRLRKGRQHILIDRAVEQHERVLLTDRCPAGDVNIAPVDHQFLSDRQQFVNVHRVIGRQCQDIGHRFVVAARRADHRQHPTDVVPLLIDVPGRGERDPAIGTEILRRS